MADPRYVTLDELRALVLPLAARVGELRREVEELRAELAAKLPDDNTTPGGTDGSKHKHRKP